MRLGNLAKAICEVSEVKGKFVLRSGVTSDHYFDKYQFECRPALLLQVAQALLPRVPANVEVFAGLEMGGIPLAVMLGFLTGRETAFVRKTAKEYGTRRLAEGVELRRREILLIEDVVTSGSALCEATTALRADGVDVSRALCVIERNGTGRKALSEMGVQLDCLFNEEELHAAKSSEHAGQ